MEVCSSSGLVPDGDSTPDFTSDAGLIAFTFETVTSRAGNILYGSCYPNRSAYWSAQYRLKKAGLIAYRRTGGKMPVLLLTDEGDSKLSPACRRRPPWPKDWSGRWSLLVYDIPEKSRIYRDTLRSFLTTMRMGCLQRSVWISPLDIRPAFDDLAKAGGVNEFSFLFESRTVLGQSAQSVVETAWKMSRLRERQQWYLAVYRENLEKAEKEDPGSADLCALAREELAAYVTIMESDPFLPRPLWPPDYAGEEAWIFHREFGRRLASLLQ
ncbi:MAG: PaaX family transcriptional regulator C-terminal domain-containing protein [Kiritimatiellia bacterium]|nr:PaaX family transcriptional regulator C-terminal domain-containing protein [Kiritimatiellia bacterium]